MADMPLVILPGRRRHEGYGLIKASESQGRAPYADNLTHKARVTG